MVSSIGTLTMVSGPIVRDVDASGGVASTAMYLIKKDEDYWTSLEQETRDALLDRWTTEAEELGVQRAVLQLTPDPLFPRDLAKQMPYIEWQRRLGGDNVPKTTQVCPCCKRALP